jgi:hypothetical protein
VKVLVSLIIGNSIWKTPCSSNTFLYRREPKHLGQSLV